MGSVNISNTGSGASVTLSSNGTALLLNGSAIGGGGSTLTISNKTAAYTVIAGDLGTIINCTSNSFTVSLTAAATLGSGFSVTIWNTATTSSHAITIDPAGAETIDGVATLILRRGEGMQIVCDGTNWQTNAKKVMRAYADNLSASTTRPTASGAEAFAIGGSANASGDNCYALGTNANSTGTSTIALGTSSTASGTQFAMAIFGTANASYSMAIGRYSSTVSVIGKYAYSSGYNTGTVGQVQGTAIVLQNITTNATVGFLSTDGGTASSTNQATLQDSSAQAFSMLLVARQQNAGGTATAAWKIEGVARRAAGAATTTLISSTITVLDNTPGWVVAVVADTTNGAIRFNTTGAAATNIRWVGYFTSAEVVYP